ncbi:hypothetical protein HZS_97 [Henneguya salminicola]|nr:hypothetical protein HZS_97 [Henneguya salminicola]
MERGHCILQPTIDIFVFSWVLETTSDDSLLLFCQELDRIIITEITFNEFCCQMFTGKKIN